MRLIKNNWIKLQSFLWLIELIRNIFYDNFQKIKKFINDLEKSEVNAEILILIINIYCKLVKKWK